MSGIELSKSPSTPRLIAFPCASSLPDGVVTRHENPRLRLRLRVAVTTIVSIPEKSKPPIEVPKFIEPPAPPLLSKIPAQRLPQLG